jgi:hypothetical protein
VIDDIVSRGAKAANIIVVCVVAAPPALLKLSEKYKGACPPACNAISVTNALALVVRPPAGLDEPRSITHGRIWSLACWHMGSVSS